MELVSLLIMVLIFAIIVWGGFWVCNQAGFPPPVRWIFGALCLIIVMIYLLKVTGIGLPNLTVPH